MTMSDLEKRYQDTLDFLYKFVDFSLQRASNYVPGQYNLDQMWQFVEALGNPQTRYPIIHVAGTKGKGSVAALCASALRQAGYRVGLYTSPHLDDFAERIQVNGENISHADLVALVDQLRPTIQAIPRLTTFEIATAMAFVYFAQQKVDVAVIEVGLGGRLDATNVLTPRVSVITSLSYDHTYVLGNTLAEIASEKAGIIKPGVPVVLSPQVEEARQVVEQIARQRNAPLVQVGLDYGFQPLSHSLDGQTLLVWPKADQERVESYLASDSSQGWEPTYLTIPLLGAHQVVNAATAYAALQTARETGLSLSEEAIRAGFEQVFWPGRFEVLSQEPPIVIDCAHNRDSALRLRQTLDTYFPGLPVVMVFGASEDKDAAGMFDELMPRVQQVVAVKSFHPRAMDPQILVDLAQQRGKTAHIVLDVADGFEEARRLAGREALVLVTGSIFVVAGARIAWMKPSVSSL